jgi:hypothetical protein
MGETVRVVIPYAPRKAFEPYHANTKRNAITVAHRRAGKTVARLNRIIRDALTGPNDGRYGYLAPTYTQAKDIAWNYLKHFTAPLLEHGGSKNEAELSVTLPNGAIIRLYGAESYDRMRGLYFNGVALDECQDIPPVALTQVILPALADRQGWLDAAGTPKGRAGLLYDLKKMADDSPDDWFRQELKASETGILPQDELDRLRKLMPENEYLQEMECSFDAAVTGAYYAKELLRADADGRITNVPHEPVLEVHTAWDLGVSDSTTIVFWQQSRGGELRIIDYYEASGYGLDHYAKALKEKPYTYGKHYAPHDIQVRELGSGKSRLETAATLGIRFSLAPNIAIADGIGAVRLMLPKCWIDKTKCATLIEALRLYREKRDEKRGIATGPLHDWTSHAADAMRYMAVSQKQETKFAPIQYKNIGIV